MANKGRTKRAQKPNKKTSKAQGDDQGAAWEINDSRSDRNEVDEKPLPSRFDQEYQGEAWKINENTEGS